MAAAVASAMVGRRNLVVQAGTGTGKSLAYLVPAALSGERIVVATATKALQDQLADKDLPLVATATDNDLRFAVLKGRSNYVCRQRVSEIGGPGGQLSLAPGVGRPTRRRRRSDPGRRRRDTSDPATLADQVRSLVRWAEDTTTGDRAELPFEPHFRAWAMVSTTARECPGAFRCPSGRDCFAEDARARAAEADVIVVNTHLYGAHLASGGAVLPEHQVVVFDEAHEVEDVMTDSLGLEVGPGRFRALAVAARPVLGDDDGASRAVEAVADLADVFHRVLRPWSGRRVPHGDLSDGTSTVDPDDRGGDGVGPGPSAGGPDDDDRRTGRARPRARPATQSPAGDSPASPAGAHGRGERPRPRHPGGPGHRPGRSPRRPPAAVRAGRRGRRGLRRPLAPGPCTARRRSPGGRPGPSRAARVRGGRLGRGRLAGAGPAGIPHRRRTDPRRAAVGLGHRHPDLGHRAHRTGRAPGACRTAPPTPRRRQSVRLPRPTRCCTWRSRCPTGGHRRPSPPSTTSSRCSSRRRVAGRSRSSPAGGRCVPPSRHCPTGWRSPSCRSRTFRSRPWSRPSGPTSRPACSPHSGSGRGWTSPVGRSAWSPSTGSRSPGPTTRSSRPGGSWPGRVRSARSTCPGPGRCWPRAPAGSSDPPPIMAWSPCWTAAWPRRATGRHCSSGSHR